jgi:pyruvate dehydrogenase E2 component (dihydrolipoamide acetyltransferase)
MDPTPLRSGGRGHRHASVVLSPLVRHRAQQLHVDPEALAGSGPGGRVTRRDVEEAAHPRAPRPDRPAASPRARRLAAAAGIDLSTLSGSGPDGAVVARDVPAARPPAAPREAISDRRQSMRTAIARQMARANAEIPHYHVASTLDLSRALAWLDTYNRELPPGERILPAALLLRAVAAGARVVPELNGWWIDGAFDPAPQVDLGVAISLRGGGLVNPTIPAVDRSTLPETMAALRRIVTSARRGGLRGSDLAPASITVTNLGEQGAEEVIGVIQPPQVALVGIGRIVERVLAVDGHPVVAPTVRVTVSGDHRATDGHAGSQMVAAIDRALAHPESL